MTLLDALATDHQNMGSVVEGDRSIRDGLLQSLRLCSKANEEIVGLRVQIARFVNAVTENGSKLLGRIE